MALDPFLSHLAELCRAHPSRAKWVFVPAHAIGLTLGDRLAREGCAWANLRFATPLDVATRMAAPFLLERGIDPSEDKLGGALVMRLLLDLPPGQDYFRPVAEHTSMAEALWRTLRELRYAGVRSADLASRPFTGIPSKQAELTALLSSYESHLAAERIADMPFVFEESARHTDWSPVRAEDLIIEMPGTPWPPLVRNFLDLLPGIRMPVPVIPNWIGEVGMAISEKRLGGSIPSLSLFHAGGRDAEIDEVFRRIARAGLPLDQVEIACAASVQASFVREKAERLGWPVTLSAGLHATMTRPGRLLLRFCDWLESGFEAAELRRLLQSGDCWSRGFDADAADGHTANANPTGEAESDETDPSDEAALSPGQAARLLLKAQATSGRDTYRRALTRVAEQYERRAADAEAGDEDRAWQARKGRQARALVAWVETTLLRIPAVADLRQARVPLAALVDAASAFLQVNAGRRSAWDAMGLSAVTGALEDLRSLGGYECALPSGLKFLRERVGSLTVGRDRPRPGSLHVSSLRDAGYDGRPHVFIVGLEEGAVFGAAVEDPVLLDEERGRLGAGLLSSVDRQREELEAVLARLAALEASAERLCFSFSCRDTREFRETFPSWIVLDACRRQQGDTTITYGALKEYLGEPVSPVAHRPEEALTDAAWWLAHACAAPGRGAKLAANLPGRGSKLAANVPGPGATPPANLPGRGAELQLCDSVARSAILRAFPALASGVTAARHRESDVFTEFDGFVPQAGGVLDPSVTGRAVSATTLEDAAKCPLRFFMRIGLGVRPIEEGKADEDAWLPATTRGLELHALYARIMRAVRAEGREPSLQLDLARLHEWGRARLAELRQEMPPPSDEVCQRESREFLEDLDAFLAAECEGWHGRGAMSFEVSFGFPLTEGEEEPLASADPLVIDIGDGRRLVLHGRIDRINRIGAHEYEVADYKGSYWPDDWQGTFAGGTRLQHAIYGAAAAQLLHAADPKARVVRGTYLFPRVRAHRARKFITAPSRQKLVAVLRDLADVIGIGAFAPATEGSPCTWCEFKSACHAGGSDHTAAKVDDLGNGALAPYRRLRQNHE